MKAFLQDAHPKGVTVLDEDIDAIKIERYSFTAMSVVRFDLSKKQLLPYRAQSKCRGRAGGDTRK